MEHYKSLDGVRMNVIKTDPDGVVNKDTFFLFSQEENIVSASYSGGKIKQGFLIGILNENKLIFSYCQLQKDGNIDNGQSACELSMSENGKLRLTENFTWASREGIAGINVFEEL
jgi:hypothetical protein